jgi:ribosomal 50S subunit-associated protein YjgA (DUF615 family)
MDKELPIQLFKLNLSDSNRLLVLKSQFNRHAVKLNSLGRYLNELEKEQLLTILTYLHQQVEAYQD